MSSVLSVEPLAAPDRAELWREALSHAYVPLDVRLSESDPSPGRIESDRLGAVRVIRVQAGPQVVSRSRRLITDGRRSVILTLQQQGTTLKEQDGREAVLGPGDFSLSDSTRLFRKRVDGRFRFTSFVFPRDELQVREEDLKAVTATAFTERQGSEALVASYLRRMAAETPGLDVAVRRQFAATGLDLLALLINERRGRFAPQGSQNAAAMLVRVKDHILRNLSDPGLSPSAIAAAHFMSVRYLHKLFEAEGVTVGEWTRAQRLDRCRRDLLRPSAARSSVAAVARRWGFVSASHFSRVFRAAYGMPPRDWQVHGLRAQESAPQGV